MAAADLEGVRGQARLLELDPELGQLLDPQRFALAQNELRVRVTSFEVGEWDGGRLADADPGHLGLLVLEGVLAREVVLDSTISTELLGPTDIVRPWQLSGPSELLRVDVRWNVLSRVKLALVDRRAAAVLGRYPEVGVVVVDRLVERALRLSITQAISQLNRVDNRLMALFWHLAERWGKVAREGIAVPLVLSHRLLGELIGARRPTVSTALADLARTEQLVRREDGTWLLTGEPVNVPKPRAAEVIRQRRRLLPAPIEQARPAVPSPVGVAGVDAVHVPAARLTELRETLAAMRTRAQAQRGTLDALQHETRAIRERTIELRTECLERIDLRRSASGPRRQRG